MTANTIRVVSSTSSTSYLIVCCSCCYLDLNLSFILYSITLSPPILSTDATDISNHSLLLFHPHSCRHCHYHLSWLSCPSATICHLLLHLLWLMNIIVDMTMSGILPQPQPCTIHIIIIVIHFSSGTTITTTTISNNTICCYCCNKNLKVVCHLCCCIFSLFNWFIH